MPCKKVTTDGTEKDIVSVIGMKQGNHYTWQNSVTWDRLSQRNNGISNLEIHHW
jgi:hypothetical protein